MGGGGTHSMTIFLELLNILDDFLNKILEIILVPSSYFPLLSQFHYQPLLKMTLKFEILILGQKNEDGYKQF